MTTRTPMYAWRNGLMLAVGTAIVFLPIVPVVAQAELERKTARMTNKVDALDSATEAKSFSVRVAEWPGADASAPDVSAKQLYDGGEASAAGGTCNNLECDFCFCGTPFENNCPNEWFFDNECDCGCQFCDLACFDCSVQDCIGGGLCGAECDFCWIGTAFQDNCPLEWCGDFECDCGCQFTDSDCPGGSCACNPVCGNGTCEFFCGENCANCTNDCGCGACCVGEECSFTEEVNCTGVYFGDDTTCDGPDACELGSCCRGDGSCDANLGASQCSAADDLFRPGISCITACETCSPVDVTRAVFVDAAGVPVSSIDRPGNCSIDARQPHAIDNAALSEGWDRLILCFACDPAEFGLGTVDFLVSVAPAGIAPAVQNITTDGVANTLTVHLDGPIVPGHWTCITIDFYDISWCAGYLPADANQDRVGQAGDILSLINSINGVPGEQLPVYATDIDRSGVTNSQDILRLIDLLNGADQFTSWNAATLPACPSGKE